MTKKFCFYNFGLLNPNILLVFRFARHENLGTDDNPGNTEAMSKKQMTDSDSTAQNYYMN